MKSQDEQEVAWLLQEKYNGEKTTGFFADCKALALGEPLAYLIGQAPFLDCTIDLTGRPLIPRVETEFWVEQAIATIKESQSNQPDLFMGEETDRSSLVQSRLSSGGVGWGEEGATESGLIDRSHPLQILDLCAGSGCIGVAVARAVPEARVDFGEIDRRLIKTIQKNINKNVDNPKRCRVFHSNLFTNLSIATQPNVRSLDEGRGTGSKPQESYVQYGDETSGARNEAFRQNTDIRYDFILSNPPYIDPALNRVDESVKDFEPHLALFGGTDGLTIIEQLIADAPQHLAPTGQLWIEHEPEQAPAIATLATEHGFTCTTHTDLYNVRRYSILVLQ